MVDDPLRTAPLIAAVQAIVTPNSTVLDIGTGTGVLAIAAAKAGAKQVWAIDCDAEALAVAQQHAQRAHLADRIAFIEGLSFDCETPEPVDLIICETVGSFAFDENILATLGDAAERLLKPGGHTVPQRLELWGAPIDLLPELRQPASAAGVDAAALLAPPTRLAAVDFATAIPRFLETTTSFRCNRSGTVVAFALWPVVTWGNDRITDASPQNAPTHWKQGILPIDARAVAAGEHIVLDFHIGPHPHDPLLQTERLWRWAE